MGEAQTRGKWAKIKLFLCWGDFSTLKKIKLYDENQIHNFLPHKYFKSNVFWASKFLFSVNVDGKLFAAESRLEAALRNFTVKYRHVECLSYMSRGLSESLTYLSGKLLI